MFLFYVIANIFESRSDKNDEEYWDAFLSGDKDALSKIFLKYYGDLYRYGLKIYPNEELVRDGIQILFLRLWEKKELLDHAIAVKKYLIVSMRRILLRLLKQHDSRNKRNHKYFEDFHQTNEDLLESIILNEEISDRSNSLKIALKKLTERQKEIIFLKFYEGYSNREISEMVNLTYQRVCNISHEALVKLRQCFEYEEQ